MFFVNDLNSGGIENYLLRFLSHYEGNIVPVVVCKGGVFGDLEQEYRKISNIELVKLKVGYLDFPAYKNLYQFFKKRIMIL